MLPESRTIKAVFAAIISVSLFASCQKEQLSVEPLPGAQPDIALSTARKVTDSEALKAYDKAMQEIMNNMMQEMNQMQMTCDPDIDFANMMIMHHEAGIKMSEAELQYGHEAEAKMMAEEAIEGDEASIQRLEAFLSAHPQAEPLSDEMCRQYTKEIDAAMKTMINCMKAAGRSNDVDVNYAAQMICHHQGALDMSTIELKYGDDTAARAEASKIITEQSAHIMMLANFINMHGPTTN